MSPWIPLNIKLFWARIHHLGEIAGYLWAQVHSAGAFVAFITRTLQVDMLSACLRHNQLNCNDVVPSQPQWQVSFIHQFCPSHIPIGCQIADAENHLAAGSIDALTACRNIHFKAAGSGSSVALWVSSDCDRRWNVPQPPWKWCQREDLTRAASKRGYKI